MDSLFYVFAVAAFGAVFLLAEGGYLWWASRHGSEAQRVARRLNLMTEAARESALPLSIVKQRQYSRAPRVERALRRVALAGAIDRLLMQAGVKWSVAQFLALSAGLMVVSLAVLSLWPMPPLAGLAVMGLFLAFPYLLVGRARRARVRQLEQQLPDGLDFMARALRAGHSFTNVLNMAGTELMDPLGGEFRAAHNEISVGVSLNDALQNLGDRIPLADVRYLIIAVVIQRESGGNLAEILGNIARVVRERLKLLGQVRVLSAEGRLSAWILGLLPFVMLAVMFVANAEYMRILWTDPTGIKLMWYGAGMLALGTFWLSRLIRIRV